MAENTSRAGGMGGPPFGPDDQQCPRCGEPLEEEGGKLRQVGTFAGSVLCAPCYAAVEDDEQPDDEWEFGEEAFDEEEMADDASRAFGPHYHSIEGQGDRL